MKQATNPFAPVSLWRKRLPGYAAMGAATVAMAVGLIAMQHARTTVAGTLLQVSEADAAAYGISAVERVRHLSTVADARMQVLLYKNVEGLSTPPRKLF